MSGEAQLGIKDEKLVPTDGNVDVAAAGLSGRITANHDATLRARAVHGATAKSVRAAGEETFTGRHSTAGKSASHARLETARPDQFLLHGHVHSTLSEKAREVEVGTDRARRQVEIKGLV